MNEAIALDGAGGSAGRATGGVAGGRGATRLVGAVREELNAALAALGELPLATPGFSSVM